MDTTIPSDKLSHQIDELSHLYISMRKVADRFREDDKIAVEVSQQALDLLRANIVALQSILYGVVDGREDDTLVRCAQD